MIAGLDGPPLPPPDKKPATPPKGSDSDASFDDPLSPIDIKDKFREKLQALSLIHI